MVINKEGDLVSFITCDWIGRECKYYIPAKHVAMIKKNMLEGKPWWLASPVYEITREQAAFILAHAH